MAVDTIKASAEYSRKNVKAMVASTKTKVHQKKEKHVGPTLDACLGVYLCTLSVPLEKMLVRRINYKSSWAEFWKWWPTTAWCTLQMSTEHSPTRKLFLRDAWCPIERGGHFDIELICCLLLLRPESGKKRTRGGQNETLSHRWNEHIPHFKQFAEGIDKNETSLPVSTFFSKCHQKRL